MVQPPGRELRRDGDGPRSRGRGARVPGLAQLRHEAAGQSRFPARSHRAECGCVPSPGPALEAPRGALRPCQAAAALLSTPSPYSSPIHPRARGAAGDARWTLDWRLPQHDSRVPVFFCKTSYNAKTRSRSRMSCAFPAGGVAPGEGVPAAHWLPFHRSPSPQGRLLSLLLLLLRLVTPGGNVTVRRPVVARAERDHACRVRPPGLAARRRNRAAAAAAGRAQSARRPSPPQRARRRRGRRRSAVYPPNAGALPAGSSPRGAAGGHSGAKPETRARLASRASVGIVRAGGQPARRRRRRRGRTVTWSRSGRRSRTPWSDWLCRTACSARASCCSYLQCLPSSHVGRRSAQRWAQRAQGVCVSACRLNAFLTWRGQIRDFLASAIARRGAHSALYLSGMPGTGKTATVKEVVRELRRRTGHHRLPKFKVRVAPARRGGGLPTPAGGPGSACDAGAGAGCLT